MTVEKTNPLPASFQQVDDSHPSAEGSDVIIKFTTSYDWRQLSTTPA